MDTATIESYPGEMRAAKHAAAQRRYRARVNDREAARSYANGRLWWKIGVPEPDMRVPYKISELDNFAKRRRFLNAIGAVAEAVHALPPKESLHFEYWYASQIDNDIIGFIEDLNYWLADGLENGGISKFDIDFGDLYQCFIDNYDEILALISRWPSSQLRHRR